MSAASSRPPRTSPAGHGGRPSVLLLLALVAAGLYGSLFLRAWSAHSGRFVCDFGAHWLAARAALDGNAARVYDQAWFVGRLRAELSPAYPAWSYKYPPVHLLLYAPLATLPHDTALLLLDGLSLLAMAGVLRMAGASWPQTLLLLAAPVTAKNLFHGQNGLLAGALLGAGFLLLATRPVAAGLVLALLSFKPQFLLVAPVVLLAGGHRRALLALVLGSAALATASAAAFGFEPWTRFLGGVGTTVDALALRQAPAPRSFTWTGLLTLAGVDRSIVRPVQAVLSVATIALAATLWRRPLVSRPARLLAVLLATPLASPYGLDYDLGVLCVVGALAWNLRDDGGAGPLLWLVPLAWWLPPVASFLGRTAAVQVGPVVLAAMFLSVALPALASAPRDASSVERGA